MNGYILDDKSPANYGYGLKFTYLIETELHQLQADKLAWGKLAGTIGLEHKDGTVKYVLNTLNLSDKFTTEDLFNDVNKFLEEEYNLLTDFDSVLWPGIS